MDKKRLNTHTLGIIFVLLEAFFFSLMSFYVKLAGDLPTMEKAFFRNVVAAVVALVLLARTPEKFRIKKGCVPNLILRSAFGTIGVLCNFYAISRLGIADANILNKLSPFFAIVMSAFILKEIPNSVEWFSVLLAFIGAAFVIKPSAGITSLPAFIGLLGGFGAGTAYTYVRKLSKRGERGPVIVAFFSTFSCLVCLPGLIFDFEPMSARQLIFLLLAGAAAAGGQLSVTAAYRLAPAKEISVFDYSQVLFAALLGAVFLGEIPDGYSVIGYIIIIGTAVGRWFYNLRSYKE